jgi:thiol:disulfide interchange protein
MRLNILRICMVMILMFTAVGLNAQTADKHVKFDVKPSVTTVKAGEEFTVRIVMEFEDHWYTYGIIEKINEDFIGPSRTEITIEPTEAVTLVKIIAEKPKSKYDEGFEMDIDYYKPRGRFDLILKAEKDLDFSVDKVTTVVYLQLCTDEKCLAGEEYKTVVAAEIYDASVTFEPQAESTDSGEDVAETTTEETSADQQEEEVFKTQTQKDLDAAREKGIWYFILFAAGFGGVSLLMPCVFPMIPITVSFFTQRAEENKGGSGLKDATAYAGPFVGAVLMSASQGEWFYPIIGMLSFSTVLAAPFFLLALFPAALTAMPRAGAWMNNIKIVMAFIVLPTSLYFISNAFVDFGIGFLTREVFLSLTAMCMLMNFLYLLGIFKTDMDAPVQHLSVARMFMALIFGTLTLFFMSGLFGRQLGELETFLPQSETSVAVSGGTASHAEL